jgi:hypothetical protein
MIYLDEPFKPKSAKARVFVNRSTCHLSADTEQELEEYAEKIGLPLAWIQHRGQYSVHFNITEQWLDRVMSDPEVVMVSRREFGLRLVAKRRAAGEVAA